MGLMVSSYHYYIQISDTATSCSLALGASCSSKLIFVFGYITIPALALSCFAALLMLALANRGGAYKNVISKIKISIRD